MSIITTNAGGDHVQFIGRLDRKIYSCLARILLTDEIVITDERVRHSNFHKAAYKKYGHLLPEILASPDYILADRKNPNTGLVFGKIRGEDGRHLQIVLRIRVASDPGEYKNSVISCWDISEKRLENYLRNQRILYKRPGL